MKLHSLPAIKGSTHRHKILGRLIRTVCHTAENTPLRTFGLSHFLVLQKPPA